MSGKAWAKGRCLAAERVAAIARGDAAGKQNKEIAAELGIGPAAVSQLRRRWLSGTAEQIASVIAPAPVVARRCLRCRETFESEGRHNWICTSCTVVNAAMGDVEYPTTVRI